MRPNTENAPVIDDCVGAEQAKRRRRGRPSKMIMGSQLKSVNRFKDFRPNDALIEGLLLFGEVSILAAPSNIGKTSIVAAIAAHAAAGADLGEREVTKSHVIYVAAEDERGVLVRGATALKKLPGKKLSFDAFGEDIDLTSDKEMEKFSRSVATYMEEHKARRLFLVVDTMNLCIGDGDENSSADMRKAIKNASKLAKRRNAHVLIIHHTSHADPTRARGSSVIGSNADTVLVLENATTASGDKLLKLYAPKQRNLDKKESEVFWRLCIDDLGTSRRGKAIKAPYAEPYAGDQEIIPVIPKSQKQNTSVSEERAQHLVAVLKGLDQGNQGKWHAWASIRDKVAGPFEELKSKPDALRKALARARETLEADKRIEVAEDGSVRIRP